MISSIDVSPILHLCSVACKYYGSAYSPSHTVYEPMQDYRDQLAFHWKSLSAYDNLKFTVSKYELGEIHSGIMIYFGKQLLLL